jgi:hypothetical protein
MISQTDFVRPPRVAVGLVMLFGEPGGAESILGDLLEEFSQMAAQSGPASARRWYWRQAARTALHLLAAGYRSAPWTISAIVVGAFLLRWYVSMLTNVSVERAISAVYEKYFGYGNDPANGIWLVTRILLLYRFFFNVLVGVLVGRVAKGREMTATTALALLGDVLALQATLMYFSRTRDEGILWTLPWSFAFSIAIVIGGVIVRMRRAGAADDGARPSTT